MRDLNYQLFQEFQQFQQKQQFKLPPQQSLPPQNHQFMPQNETQEQQNQDVQHQQNETQEQRNVEVQQTQEQQNQDVQDQQNEQDLFRRLCQTIRNKGLQKLRSCLPIAAAALAALGASTIAISPQIQKLSQGTQLVINVAVVLYVALSTAVTWNAFPRAAVNRVRRGLGLVEKAVCYVLLILIWSITVVGGDYALGFGIGCIATHLQFVLWLRGYKMNFKNLLPALCALAAMVLVHAPVNSNLAAVVVLSFAFGVMLFP